MERGRAAADVIAALIIFMTGCAFAVEVGQKAPDFELPSTKGGKLKLSTFQGKKSVLIEYVLDFTPA
jgi:hypothetical protein